jgi:hypothetical protein
MLGNVVDQFSFVHEEPQVNKQRTRSLEKILRLQAGVYSIQKPGFGSI